MNRKVLSIIWTVIIYSLLVSIFTFVIIDIKTKEDKFIILGFETIRNEFVKGVIPKGGGTEDVFSTLGDVPLEIKKTKQKLSLLEKPPYKGGKLYDSEEGEKKFTLSGELSKRRLIHFLKPEYPEGISENTVVKLSISANPDGAVATIDIVKTGGLVFDQNAIQAVREWRFQPLPPNVEQVLQTGIVTIYFQVR